MLRGLIFGFKKLSFIECLISPLALNNLSKCKVAMLKVRCQAMVILVNKGVYMTSQRMVESPLAWDPETKRSNFWQCAILKVLYDCKVDLSEQGLERGSFLPMRKLISSSSLIFELWTSLVQRRTT